LEIRVVKRFPRDCPHACGFLTEMRSKPSLEFKSNSASRMPLVRAKAVNA
jgi:hypothetical protein